MEWTVHWYQNCLAGYNGCVLGRMLFVREEATRASQELDCVGMPVLLRYGEQRCSIWPTWGAALSRC